MNIHIALYKWKTTVTPEQVSQALEDVEALAIDFVTGENTSKYSKGYTHVIVVRGKEQAAIDAYRNHPDHAKVATVIEAMEDRGVGVDFSTDLLMNNQPPFIPKPGQVDYTNIRYAPTVNIVVTYNGKILAVKRSANLRIHPNYWDWVCGFLDDQQSIEEKAYEELREELGLQPQDIEKLTRGQTIIDEDSENGKTWLIVPALAEVKTDKFTLDWEASQWGWFTPKQLQKLDFVPGSLKVAGEFFPELRG